MDLESLRERLCGGEIDFRPYPYIVEDVRPDIRDDRGSLVSDVVAMANWARLSGRSACLLFEVAPKGSIEDSKCSGKWLSGYSARGDGETCWPPFEDAGAVEAIWRDHILDPYVRVIQTFVRSGSLGVDNPSAEDPETERERQYQIQLLRSLTDCYSDDELRTLCFHLRVDYDDLSGGGREGKSRELITYLLRRGRLAELIRKCREQRPTVAWGEMPQRQQVDLDLHVLPIIEAGKMHAALLVNPSKTEQPYHVVEQDILGIERYYVWLNGHAEPLKATDALEQLTCWKTTPYLTPQQWLTYLSNLKLKIEGELKVVPDTPGQDDLYQDLYVRRLSGPGESSAIKFVALWDDMLSSTVRNSQILLFVGEPGAGKTERIKRSLYHLAQAVMAELEGRKAILEPRLWIPMYVPIASYDLRQDVEALAVTSVVRLLSLKGSEQRPLDRELLRTRQLRFLIAIDGVDEMSHVSWEDKIASIEGFADRYQRAQHAITCRMSRTPGRWQTQFSTYEVLPLSAHQIRSYLDLRLSPSLLESWKVTSLILEFEDLLAIPRNLKTVGDELCRRSVLNPGTTVQVILASIREVELERTRFDKRTMSRFYHQFEQYSVRCLEVDASGLPIRLVRTHNILTEEEQEWLVNAGLLNLVSDPAGSEIIGFSHAEYRDCGVAQSLLEAQKTQQLQPELTGNDLPYAKLWGLVRKNPGRYARIIRYYLNLLKNDLSEQPSIDWLNLLSPVLQLQVLAERQQIQFKNVNRIGSLFARLDHLDPGERTLALRWLSELLVDPYEPLRQQVVANAPLGLIRDLREEVLEGLTSSSWEFLARVMERLEALDIPLNHGQIKGRILLGGLLSSNSEDMEAAMLLVARFTLSWATEEIYNIASNKSGTMNSELERLAQDTLGQLGDPRYLELGRTATARNLPESAIPSDSVSKVSEEVISKVLDELNAGEQSVNTPQSIREEP